MFLFTCSIRKNHGDFNEVGIDSNNLPDPELIDGQPTKSNVWRSLVDVTKNK